MQRYFRAAAHVYEGMRLQLDGQFGHPSPATVSAYAPIGDAVTDDAGFCYLAVRAEFCEWPQVSAALGQLITDGDVEEITRQQYRTVAAAQSEQWP